MLKKGDIINKNIGVIVCLLFVLSNIIIILPSEKVSAGSYNGEDLALAILANSSYLISSSYSDTDPSGTLLSIVLNSKGPKLQPTHGDSFIMLSTGIAGVDIVTTDELEPGDERGGWHIAGKYGHPRDEATLALTLQVPPNMHYLYYDVQFFSTEYPEYVGTQYNDELTVTVNSPSEGVSTYFFDINSGYFVWDSNGLEGTGFDVFARSGNPSGIDWIDTTPRTPGADAGASDLITIGGTTHPVSPNEQITITFNIIDKGDNMFDSAAFIDNLDFSGWAKTDISAKKTYNDINNGMVECGDTIRYTIAISNTGEADQNNNPGNEFEDIIPDNTTFVSGSETATIGTINYDSGNNKIIWNGGILSESTVVLTFDVAVNNSLENGTVISNQGNVYWDSNEDGTNDALEYTDDPYTDDLIDKDGDGDTNDDDPTNFTVLSYNYPDNVEEGFADDTPGYIATESFFGHPWFETTKSNIVGTVFEVVENYKYSTEQAFKIKMRSTGSPQYWNYTLSNLNSTCNLWETWFACGDASEEYNLYLNFSDENDDEITRLKFEYAEEGTDFPTNWVLKMYYYNPVSGWQRIISDYTGGYLHNNWYKIRLIKNGDDSIIYSLNRSDVGEIDRVTGNTMIGSFDDLSSVKISTNTNPVVCPMFFFDEHKVGLDN